MMDMNLLFSGALSLLMAAAFYTDLTRYLIPNWIVLGVMALYPLFVLTAPVPEDWVSGLIALGVMFAGGFALYALRLMGAGDIKLLMALSLWCGFSETLLLFLFCTVLLGGALAIVLYGVRLLLPAALARREHGGHIPRLLTHGEPIPYGLAITSAFLWVIWSDEIPGLGFYLA